MTGRVSVYEKDGELHVITNMPKHYKDMIDELTNKMNEDAPQMQLPWWC